MLMRLFSIIRRERKNIMKILVVGSSNIDTTLYVRSLPKDGETISALSRNVALGGKGLNQAIAIKRAGGEITF